MATISDIATWCTTTVLKRNDITTEAVEMALEVYKLVCQKIPFEGLQTLSAELACTAGTGSYSLAALDPTVCGIMSIRFTQAAGQTWRLRRSHTRVYDAVQYTAGIGPRTYARFGNSIEFLPVPSSSSSTYRIRYWGNPTIAATAANTVLVNPSAWDALMKWETLYRLYYIIGEPEKAMTLIQPAVMPRQASPRRQPMFEVGIIPRLWNDLLLTISQHENVDEDFSINPIQRAYTHRA